MLLMPIRSVNYAMYVRASQKLYACMEDQILYRLFWPHRLRLPFKKKRYPSSWGAFVRVVFILIKKAIGEMLV